MAFFGLTYDKKDFDKNTRIFIDQLNNILMENYSEKMGSGALINSCINLLSSNPYPINCKGKEQKPVDERILALINTLRDDMQQESPALFSSHASMLLSAIKDSRKYGKERYTPDELHAQEEMAKCRAAIHDALDRKQKIINAKEKVLRDASKTNDQAVIAKARMEFNVLSKQEETCEKEATMFLSRYNQFVDVMNQRQIGGAVRKLKETSIVSVADYAKEVAETNELLAQEAQIDIDMGEITADANSAFNDAYGNFTTSSSFDELLEDKKTEMANSAINSANVQSANVAEEDAFAKAMSKLNN